MTISEANYPVPENIERLIAEKGLKKRFVAERSNLSPNGLSDILNGRRSISPAEIVMISRAMDVDLGELFADTSA